MLKTERYSSSPIQQLFTYKLPNVIDETGIKNLLEYNVNRNYLMNLMSNISILEFDYKYILKQTQLRKLCTPQSRIFFLT